MRKTHHNNTEFDTKPENSESETKTDDADDRFMPGIGVSLGHDVGLMELHGALLWLSRTPPRPQGPTRAQVRAPLGPKERPINYVE